LARNGDLAALVFDALSFLWTDPVAASLLAATLNRLPTFLARSGTTLLVLHDSPLGDSPTGGTPTDGTPTSGTLALSALAHTAAIRLQVVRERWLRQHGDVRGYEARVEVLKNRHGPAGRQATIAIKFNGIVRGNGL
jgi:RecA/RadA recombinase